MGFVRGGGWGMYSPGNHASPTPTRYQQAPEEEETPTNKREQQVKNDNKVTKVPTPPHWYEQTWPERMQHLTQDFKTIIGRLKMELRDRTDELSFLQNASNNLIEELATLESIPYAAQVGAIFTEGSYITCRSLATGK
eukprot:gnl/Chilomastix_caulleri/2422.p1 GENE.gnl/Chilomastix_caulleri/2422~~gnl/Chilomastix_caulleri/2422.p1  ORF type:complete len:138 (+),score=19.64 gnl/Chilomastix_caulleri/2422:21-434(+)